MYFSSPNSIPLKVTEFLQFTEGNASMDLLDITFMGALSSGLNKPEVKLFGQDSIPSENPNFKDHPSQDIMVNPGNYVYRLDLMLDSEKLEGSEVQGILVEISPRPFELLIAEDYDDLDNLANKAMTIAKNLQNGSSTETLEVIIDYRSDLNLAKNKTLAEAAQQKSNGIEQKVLFSNSTKITDSSISKINSSQLGAPSSLLNLPAGSSVQTQIKNIMASGLDPFAAKSINANLSLESKMSLTNNDVFNFEEDAVRIKSQTILGETSLSKLRAQNLSAVYESKGYSESSKQAQQLASLIGGEQSPKGSVQLGLVGSVTTKLFRVIRDIEIPKRMLGMDPVFFVKMRPIIKSENSTASLVEPVSTFFEVGHREQVLDLMRPVVPPLITVGENSPGNVTLNVKSMDPSSSELKVTRHVYNPKTSEYKNAKSLIVISDAVKDVGVKNLIPNKVYYSAAVIDASGIVGPSTSIVVDGVENPNILTNEDDQKVKIYAYNQSNGIRVNVENIPLHVKNIRIMREHLSIPGDFKSRVTALPYLYNKSNSNSTKEFKISQSENTSALDKNVVDGHHYRYFVAMSTTRGLGYLSQDDDIIIRKYPRNELNYNTYCSNPTIVSKDPLVIQMEFSASQKEDSFEFFIDLLKSTGADKQFLDEIKKNRKFLSDIIAFNVDRIDTLTGHKVNLGLYEPGTFLDGGSTGNPSTLKPGRKYVYLVRVCVKPVQSFFSNLFSGLVGKNQTSGTKVTTFMTKKFLSSVENFLGVLPSDSEIRNSSSPNQAIKAADTGLTYVKKFTTAKLRAKVANFKLQPPTAQNAKSVVLTFELSGGPKSEVLKAFLYCQTVTGLKQIDQMTIDPDSDKYYFVDSFRYNLVGTKTYMIKLLYTDTKHSSYSNQITVHKADNMKTALKNAVKNLTLKGAGY